MRSKLLATTLLNALLTLVVGCEHKNTKDEPAAPPSTGTPDRATAAKPNGEMPAEPVARAPNRGPDKAPPVTAESEVRPPVAADLAEYTKGLPGSGKLMATIDTSMGAFHCELFGDKAPMTVANFVGLATGKKAWMNPNTNSVETRKPFYDGLIWHRVIPEFMIQGGDPLGKGIGGPGYKFGDEFVPELKMQPGTLAMANAGPGTNGSQFFITEIGPDWLNGKHTVFGQCKEVDLVKQITRVPKGPGDRPETPVTITKVTISRG